MATTPMAATAAATTLGGGGGDHWLVGTKTTSGDSEGIYFVHVDDVDANRGECRLAAALVNPTFLAVTPPLTTSIAIATPPPSATVDDSVPARSPTPRSSPRFVVAVSETAAGSIHAFLIEEQPREEVAAAAGGPLQLTPFGSCPSGGDDPCHLAVHPKHPSIVAVSNYSSGHLSLVGIVHPLLHPPASPVGHHAFPAGTSGIFLMQTINHNEQRWADGSSTYALATVDSGKDVGRQESAHVHSTLWSEDELGSRLFVADLGSDCVVVYGFDILAPRLASSSSSSSSSSSADGGRQFLTALHRIRCPPGSGPRHMAWMTYPCPSGAAVPALVVGAELQAQMLVIRAHHLDHEVVRCDTLPPAAMHDPVIMKLNTTAHVAIVTPPPLLVAEELNTCCLVCSNRGGIDSLVAVAIEPGHVGGIESLQTAATKKYWLPTHFKPRHFAASRDAKYIIVGSQGAKRVDVVPLPPPCGNGGVEGAHAAWLTEDKISNPELVAAMLKSRRDPIVAIDQPICFVQL